MDHFAGLDVSVKATSVCIVDDTGRIVREVKVASEPEALLQVLGNPIYRFKRIGLEAGPLSQWLFSALAEAGLPVICVETRHMRAVLQAQINKTDRNDARGIRRFTPAGLALTSLLHDGRSRAAGSGPTFPVRWITTHTVEADFKPAVSPRRVFLAVSTRPI
jgi:hypothetical protein